MDTMKNIAAEIRYNKRIGERYFRLGMSFKTPQVLPGQFLMLRVSDGLDPLLRRPLGVYRLLDEKAQARPGASGFMGSGVEVLYEVVGRGTAILSGKEPGEVIDIIGPLGNGFPLEEARGEKKVIMVGGGMGIVPFYLLAHAIGGGLFLYGGRGAVEAGLTEDFKGVGCDIRISTDDGTVGKKGLVTELLKEEITPDSVIYACGPPGMLKNVAAMAAENGARCYVSLERAMACGIGVCLGCAVKARGEIEKEYRMVCSEGPVFDSALIDWDSLD